jgi:hypothetical protein
VKAQQIVDSVDKFVHKQVKAEGLVDNPQNTGATFEKFVENWELVTQITYDICSELKQCAVDFTICKGLWRGTKQPSSCSPRWKQERHARMSLWSRYGLGIRSAPAIWTHNPVISSPLPMCWTCESGGYTDSQQGLAKRCSVGCKESEGDLHDHSSSE